MTRPDVQRYNRTIGGQALQGISDDASATTQGFLCRVVLDYRDGRLSQPHDEAAHLDLRIIDRPQHSNTGVAGKWRLVCLHLSWQ